LLEKSTASMTTRDNVRLDADVYRPATPGPHPVLLMRQPYSRTIASTPVYAHPSWYARQGYIVAIQDVRGRGTSEGVFRPFENEADDGRDTVEWAARLPGSNGKVGMYGFSYQGMTQFFAASTRPEALKAIAPAMAAYDVFEDFAYEGGALKMAGMIGWALQLAVESARRAGDAQAHHELLSAARSASMNDLVPALPRILEKHRQYTHYVEWVHHSTPGEFWERLSPKSVAARIDIPALHIGGWFDYMLTGTLACYRDMSSRCSQPQRLIVGPWQHFPWTRSHIDSLQVRWFDHWLKGIDNGVTEEPAVQLFELGSGRWRDFDEWPAQKAVWYLASNGLAAIDPQAGCLNLSRPVTASDDSIVHDPWRPVPAATAERSEIDARGDVLTYTTPPLEQDLHLAGDVALELWCTSDRASFDVSAVLSHVHPDGKAFPVTQGYRRATKETHLRVSLRATCCLIPKGHRLRLSLAGACFPALDVNPGIGAPPHEARLIEQLPITLVVRHGGEVASRLVITHAGH
jgi:putative CocE/NonD family hydrolase